MERFPVRTCLGCGKKKGKHELLRFAVNERGTLSLDIKGLNGGRGAYCCKTSGCFLRFSRNGKKVSKALRVPGIKVNEELKGLFGSE